MFCFLFHLIYFIDLYKALVFSNNFFPAGVFPPTGKNPLIPNAFLAATTAFGQANLEDFALIFLLTTFPCLFFFKSAFVLPPPVFSLRPLKTWDLAILPLAILLTFIAFLFITPLDFAFITEDFFIAFFIDFAIFTFEKLF